LAFLTVALGFGSLPLAFFSADASSADASSTGMSASKFRNTRVNLGNCYIVASAQPLDVCRLMQGLRASLADTPDDCLDCGSRRWA
jgi:hypothetical protein